jgi:hypothetical protein
MNLNRQALLLFLLIPAWLGPRQLAAQPTPLGRETRVDLGYGNGAVYFYTDCPQIGVAPDRSFEIAWSAGRTSSTDVRARHYGANGLPTDREEVSVTRQYDVSEEDFYYAYAFAVTPVSTGGFRVLYETYDSSSNHLSFFRHRIDSSGAPVPGGSRPLGAPDTQWVWPGPGDTIFAGKYDASQRRLSVQKVDSRGMPSGTVYILNTRPIVLDPADNNRSSANPVIQPLSDGGWVAIFGGRSIAAPGSPARQVIRARKFNAAGVPLGPDFDVNSIPAGAPNSPPFLWTTNAVVATGPAGRFAVAWQVGSRSSGWSIRIRFFDAAGVPSAPETTAVHGRGLSGPISMAADNSGRIFLAWLQETSFVPGYITYDLRARLLRPDGLPVGPQFSVQTSASRDYSAPVCGTVVWTGDTWLLTWLGYYLEDETAIFLRRFR